MKNEKKKIRGYATLLILFILIFGGLFVTKVLADDIIESSDPLLNVDWSDPQENFLRLLESFDVGNFIVEAVDFYDNSVLIAIYRKNANNNKDENNKLDSTIMRIHDSWNYTYKDETINVVIKDFGQDKGIIGALLGLNVTVDQWARVSTRIAGKPIPMVSIVPEEKHAQNRTTVKRTFTPDAEAVINFTIKNVGKARLKELKLIINTTLTPLLHDDKLYYDDLDTLGAGNSTTVSVRLRVPHNYGNYTISAEATGVDQSQKNYSDNDSIFISVKPFIDKLVELDKFVPEKVFMGDITYGKLNIRNNDNNNISVSLIDTMPDGFEIIYENNSRETSENVTPDISGRTLSWNFTLEGNREKDIVYKMKAKEPGIYKFESACADVEKIGKECSEIPNKINHGQSIVSGPYVEISKLTENIGNDIKIKITMTNRGDRTAIVRLIDYVPQDYLLQNLYGDYRYSKSNLSKVIFKPIVIRTQGTSSVGYTLYNENGVDRRGYILPPVEATILDQFLYNEDRYVQKIVSNEITIK